MADKVAAAPAADKPAKTATTTGAESPTTARELDFDDDADAAATAANDTAAASLPPSKSPKSPKPGVRFSEDATEIPPPKPPRPMSPQQQAENTLIEAFPDIDAKVVKAVLLASHFKVEPAFNALLSMSDPNYQAEETPPPQPPRPAQNQNMSQEERDRLFAENLQRQEQGYYREGYGSRTRGEPAIQRQRKEAGLNPNELRDGKEKGVIQSLEEEWPEIKKNLEQGFRETQSKVSSWFDNLAKKFDGEDGTQYDKYGNAIPASHGRQNFGPSQSDQLHGIRRSAEMRRSADRERYDKDNRVLGDDFEALQLREDDAPTSKSARPLANPDLFKPTPLSPPQSGPVDEVDALYRDPSPNNQSSNTGKSGSKKWQPLTSVAPHPEPDDHDPFSLGDSDDEDAKTKDIKAEDTERLKKAAEGKEAPAGTDLKEAGRSGSMGQRDAAAEALLKEPK